MGGREFVRELGRLPATKAAGFEGSCLLPAARVRMPTATFAVGMSHGMSGVGVAAASTSTSTSISGCGQRAVHHDGVTCQQMHSNAELPAEAEEEQEEFVHTPTEEEEEIKTLCAAGKSPCALDVPTSP